MESVQKKVTKILKQAFPPPDKVTLKDEDGIIGTIISSRFMGLDSIERVKMVWKVLDQDLKPEERKRIVIILAVTPEEEIAHTC